MLELNVPVSHVSDLQLQDILSGNPEIMEPTYQHELSHVIDKCPNKRYLESWCKKNGKKEFAGKGITANFTKIAILAINNEFSKVKETKLNQLVSWGVDSGTITLTYNC